MSIFNHKKNENDINKRKISFIPYGEKYENIVKEVLENENTCSWYIWNEL